MNTLYKDGLVEVTDQEVIFHRYYLPFGGDKHVFLSRIDHIEVRQPSIGFGSWRIWGGGPRTWFPWDGARPSRDAIFVAFLRGCFVRVGFTVERSKEFIRVLKERSLLSEPASV